MRRILALGTIIALIQFSAAAVEFTKAESETIARAVAGILDMHHFTHKRLDDEISKKHLRFMIDRLDYFHMFFLQSDVDEFRESFDVRLDNMVRRGMVSPANRIFERYLKRLNEATNHIDTLLKGEFDFTVKERFQPDRHELGWPKDEKERDELWRKRVKWEMLAGVLAGDKQEEIKERIWKRYSRMSRDYGKFDSSEILQLYLAALGRAYDPHSTYMAPITAQNFDIHNVSMQLTGIGAVLTEEDGYTKIVSVSPGGPADRSKEVFPDDRIVRVGQGEEKPVDVRDMRLNDVVSMIRGPKDSEVVLTIIPADAADDAERKIVRLIRDVIKIEAQLARGYLVEMPNKGGESLKYGVIDLPTFYDRCSDDISGLIDRLESAGAKGMILDLRRNGGGLLAEAIKLAGLFIKDGPVVQVKDYQREVMELNDKDSKIAYDGPLLVMVSKHSASASEIVAAAMQDYGRGLVVGDKHTHGKGTVQTLLPLQQMLRRADIADPGKLKFTIQKFYRVAGHSTQKDGVIPDIILPNVLNVLESGEAYLPNVMESDSIARAEYESLNRVTPYLERLRVAVSKRVESDQDFKYIREDTDSAIKHQKDKTVSLNEAERRAEKKRQKDKVENRKKERRARPKSDIKVSMYKWKKTNDSERIDVITKPAPERGDDEDQEKDKKDKKPERKKKEEPEDYVPPILKDPHLREAVNVLADYVNLSSETWLVKKD